MSMEVDCWGPRGGIPAPSKKGRNGKPDFITMEYGGHTSCYTVKAGPFDFILDMGSGIMAAGDQEMRTCAKDPKTGKIIGSEKIVLLSHDHWDYIIGSPFSTPFFIGSNTFHFHGHAPAGMEGTMPFDDIVRQMLAAQQEAPFFPIAHSAMPSKKTYHTHEFQGSDVFTYFRDDTGALVYSATQVVGTKPETLPAEIKNDPKRWVEITTIPLNHPNGCLGYAISYMGDTVVYCTDNEPLLYLNAQILKYAKDADWLLLDAQYTPEQLSGMMQTFGHGTPRNCVDQAKGCNAKRCVLHHHDPRHDDTKLAAMEADAIAYAKEIGYLGIVEFAREGTTWVIE